PGTGGVAVLAGALKQLGANKRILMIGAHPDDEYSDLVALFARGMGAQVAYLSLSRGEGGQNLIGPELGPELGVIRSEELLAARRIDGARQFFARAYDFGYSKNIDEALRMWPRDSLLRDVLDVVRRFRPQIIVSVFSGTPSDGHGQHQVAGVLARQAFEALRDSSWGPVKLYRSLYSDTASATLRLDAGALDPVRGLSYHQIAMAGRSQHRSQDMGQLERPGPATARLAFIEWRERGRATGQGDGLFAGVDTLPPGRAGYAGQGPVTLDGIDVAAPAGWKVERVDAATSPVAPGTVATRRFAVTVATDAPRSQPYFLRRPLLGALYDWSGVPAEWRGLPFEPG